MAPPSPLPELPLSSTELSDLASWLRRSLSSQLSSTGVVDARRVEVETEDGPGATPSLEPHALAEAARAARSTLALGARLAASSERLEVDLRVVDAQGEERLSARLQRELGEAPWLPVELSRAVLLALGEDAAAPAPPLEEPVSALSALELARAANLLHDAEAAGALADEPEAEPEGQGLRTLLADPSEACAALTDLLLAEPALSPARDLLLAGAEGARGGRAMPAWLTVLERLAAARPGDARLLLLLGDYRLLHGEPAVARERYVQSREAAADGRERAEALGRLSALAEREGRPDEAAGLLRAAIRVADDPRLHLRLAGLLRERAPQEALRALGRAAALDDAAPGTHLEAARLLVAMGQPERAAQEAARSVQLAEAWPELAAEARALLEALEPGRRPSHPGTGHPDA